MTRARIIHGAGGGEPMIDVSLDSPQGIVEWQTAPSITGSIYRTELHPVVILFAITGHEI